MVIPFNVGVYKIINTTTTSQNPPPRGGRERGARAYQEPRRPACWPLQQKEDQNNPPPKPSQNPDKGAPHKRQPRSARNYRRRKHARVFDTPGGPKAEEGAGGREGAKEKRPRGRGGEEAGEKARLLSAPRGQPGAYLGGEPAGGRVGRESEGGPEPDTLYRRPGAAPGALIGFQRPGARADQLMCARAQRPLGEERCGRAAGARRALVPAEEGPFLQQARAKQPRAAAPSPEHRPGAGPAAPQPRVPSLLENLPGQPPLLPSG
nr:proline-rich protein 2-like [Loxodonta africana]